MTRASPSDTVYIVILVLLVLAAIHTYVKRAESEPPKWMGKLQDADAKFSFKLGVPAPGDLPDRHPDLGRGWSVPRE